MSELTEAQKSYDYMQRRMMPVRELTHIVYFLQELTPEQRIDALEYVKEASHFCWECGRDLELDEACHCTNDE